MKTKLAPAIAFALSALTYAGEGLAQQGVALTADNRLLSFDAANPSAVGAPVAVTGLLAGEMLLGMDFRPLDRTLVSVTSQNRLVVLNPATGAARLLSTLSVPLAGTAFGVDFNPVPDRLRVNTNTGLNYRINVETGAVIVDGALIYDATDSGNLAPTLVSGAAYINSVAGQLATATTLFDIDYGRDVLVLQDPPNNGVLKTVGPLGVNATEMTGFDIFSPRAGYAVFNAAGGSNLYTINLTTGAATLAGPFPAGVTVVDIAMRLKEPAIGVVNTSSRGMVGTGEGVLITGFAVLGNASINVLVVARGPSLAQFGVNLPVADPTVALYRGQTLLGQNDNWQTHPRAAEIMTSGFAPGSALESAVIMTLEPGLYTAHVAGATPAMTGIGIVEVYELP